MKRNLVISIAALLAAAPLSAQVASGGCGTREAVGYIGISGIDCNCTISAPGSGNEWSFRTEPRITSLEADSRAGAVLKIGDVITAVNGKLITTREGAQELAGIKPNQTVVLTIRRNGELLKYAFTAGSACPNDTRLLGIYAPGRPAGVAPPAEAATVNGYVAATPAPAPNGWTYAPKTTPAPYGVAPATAPPPPQAWVGAAPVRGGVYATAVPGVPYVAPRASFGISFSCSNCGMQFFQKTHTWAMNFTRPPLVYSVERGGPADRAGIRRGDIITQVNGKPIESDEGSRIFAQTKPGQTVKFTVRRDGKTQTFAVKAAARQTLPPDLTMTTRALERASQSLSEIKRTQEAQLKRLLRESSTYRSGADGDAMREAQQRLLDEEREHARKLTELSADMARANSEMTRAQLAMRAAMADSARAICAVPAIAPVAAGTTPRGVRTLRYTGSIGSADVEVRGAPVSVSENDDEIVITTGATVVRVQKKK